MNKELSAKYENLVNNAPKLIKDLPWGKDFEVDVFKKPDFTALEVLSFATGGTQTRRLVIFPSLSRVVNIKASQLESM